MMWNPHQSSVIVASRNASMTRSPRSRCRVGAEGGDSAISLKVPPRDPALTGFSVQTLGLAATQLTAIRRGRKRQNKEALIAKIHVITV